jgi:hypothetical protein
MHSVSKPSRKGDPMKTRFISLLVLLLGLSMPALVHAQPILTVSMTEIDVQGAPAFGMNLNPGGGLDPGTPTFSGNQLNGGNAPYNEVLTLWALATGTSPASGFTYNFFVNGVGIGRAVNSPNFDQDYGIAWTPPEPGVYFLSAEASDGVHTVTSLAIEFFATGIDIVSPVPNTNVPLGSSVVIQAATSLAFGAVSRVDFFDENGFLGSSRTFPYSIIYTPVGPASTVHFLHAISYKADGVTVAFNSAGTQSVGILMAPAVGPLPLCNISTPIGTPMAPSTIPIPDYNANPSAAIPVIVTASSPAGTIQQVQLYINGVLFATDSAYPYSFAWAPTVAGTYNLTALAYDDKNNIIASTTSTTATLTPAPTTVIIGSIPAVAITSPGNGGTLNGGGSATVTASATDNNTTTQGGAVTITQVQFFQDGNFVGVATQPTTPGGHSYTISFKPVQNLDPTTGQPIASILTAVATDSLGFTGASVGVTVTVTSGGSGGGVLVGTPPTVSITAPVASSNVVVNTPVTLSATAQATNSPGNVTQVEFLVDNKVLATATQYPYSVTWTPPNLGTYTIVAQVTDNDGNQANSAPVSVTVVTEPPPTISVISPSAGSLITVGTAVPLTATASSPSGTVAQVQFFENGIAVGSPVTTQPYTVQFTPTSSGVFTITAIATDNSGETMASAPVIVLAVPSTGGLGTSIYFGQYLGLSDNGRFAFALIDGTTGIFIGHSVGASSPTTIFDPDLAVSSGGSFTSPAINGTASTTGVNGNLLPSQDQFIGTVTQAGSVAVASGYYNGSLAGEPTSQFSAIVGADGEIMVYLAEGTFADSGDGTVDSTGAFKITTAAGNTVTGKVDPSTGFLTGTLNGGPGGSIIAAGVSNGTFSDGVLMNISTRGPVGTGSNIMIAGFVVGGTQPKQLLVRAIGPALTSLGVPGAIQGTQLTVFSGTTMVAQNSGWSGTTDGGAAVAAAESTVGAFSLPKGSMDSAIIGTFAPGSYTASIAGAGSDTGIALAEVYDLDNPTPFTTRKLVNVSTRGTVGTGASVMIGGFKITGATPKRLLIRGAGPALAAMGVSGALTTPHLEIFNNAGTLIRENFTWQTGNDPALLAAAEVQTGAFAFANSSADSAILIVLPPGNYTAELSGTGTATGTGLVEVYEIP